MITLLKSRDSWRYIGIAFLIWGQFLETFEVSFSSAAGSGSGLKTNMVQITGFFLLVIVPLFMKWIEKRNGKLPQEPQEAPHDNP